MKTLAPLLAAALVATAHAQNLLPNGDFESHDENVVLENWTFSPAVPGTFVAGPVIFPPDSNNIALRLIADPTGANFVTPHVLASQVVDVPIDPSSPPLRITVHARIARSPTDPSPPDSIRFAISGQTLSGDFFFGFPPNPVPFAPSVDDFFDITTSVTLSEPPTSPVTFDILKTAPGTVTIDDIAVTAQPDLIQVSPDRARTDGTSQVFIESPFLNPTSNILFGGAPANIVESQPGSVVVIAPPNPPGPTPIEIVNPGNTQPLVYDGFIYLPPFRVDRITPRPVVSGTQSAVIIEGSGFTVDTFFDINADPLPPAFPGDHTNARLVLPPLPPGPFEITAFSFSDGIDLHVTGEASDRQPLLESVEPASGPTAGGTILVIHGSNFSPDTRISLAGADAGDVNFISPIELQVLTPPNPLRATDVTATDLPTGLATTLPNAFTYLAPIPGDTNGDFVLDLADVINPLIITTRGTTGNPLDPGGDADGDGKIGLPEAIAAFEGMEIFDPLAFSQLAPPVLTVHGHLIAVGNPITAGVTGLLPFTPARIEWGDGHSTVVIADGSESHTYDQPGTYDLVLRSGAGLSAPLTVTVHRPNTPTLVGTDLRFTATPPTGPPATAHHLSAPAGSALAFGGDFFIHAPAGGTVGGDLVISDNDPVTPDTIRRIDIEVPASNEIQIELVELQLESLGPIAVGDAFTGRFLVDPSNRSTGAHPTLPASVHTPASELEDECKEIEERWRNAVAAKAAKKEDCEAREDQLDDCEDELAELEAEKDAKQAERDARQQARDDKQQEFDDLFESIDDFLGGTGTLIHYTDGSEIPENAGFVGARRNGASGGIGISFLDVENTLARNALYKKIHGHSIGKDLNKLRDCIVEMDKLDDEIEDLDARIQDLCDEISALLDAIVAKVSALSDCRQECADLESEIEDLEDAHADCLKELEDQRKKEDEAAGEISGADRAGSDADDELGDTRGSADDADDTIAGRAGSPGQKDADSAEVRAGRDCADTAEDLIAQGDTKLQEARDALALGDTDTAKQKAAEAKDLYAQAEAKLDQAQDHINRGDSSARRRKERECNDGDIQLGDETESKVWDEIVDVGLAPWGTSLRDWTRQKENAKAALKGLQDFLDLLDIFGAYSPISGPVTPCASHAAESIVNAHLELFEQRFPFEVWVDVKGHTEWHRNDRICVHGCWEGTSTGGSRGDSCTKLINIGTIGGEGRAIRKKRLEDIITRFFHQQRVAQTH